MRRRNGTPTKTHSAASWSFLIKQCLRQRSILVQRQGAEQDQKSKRLLLTLLFSSTSSSVFFFRELNDLSIPDEQIRPVTRRASEWGRQERCWAEEGGRWGGSRSVTARAGREGCSWEGQLTGWVQIGRASCRERVSSPV